MESTIDEDNSSSIGAVGGRRGGLRGTTTTEITTAGMSSSPPPPSDAGIEMECKKMCVIRCINAIGWSLLLQLLILNIFLIIINLSILHPTEWMMNVIATAFSINVYIRAIPLIISIIFYGIVLGKITISEPHYYRTKFMEIYRNFIKNGLFFISHIIYGFLLVWFYIQFLNNEYNQFWLNCSTTTTGTTSEDTNNNNNNIDSYPSSASNQFCLNGKYLILITNGIYTGWYFYVTGEHRKNRQNVITLQFPIIQQGKLFALRSQFYTILSQSIYQSIAPTLIYWITYFLIGNLYSLKIAKIFGLHFDGTTINNYHIYDLQLLIYNWIVTTLIICNMNLLITTFTIFLTEYKEFPIESSSSSEIISPVTSHQNVFATAATIGTETLIGPEICLIDALRITNITIIKDLACLDLYTIAMKPQCNDVRRKQIYALSIPGGHPYNWMAISGQILHMLQMYRMELSKSVEHFILPVDNYSMKNKSSYLMNKSTIAAAATTSTTATELAEKIRYRQFNDSFGIRNLTNFQNFSYDLQSSNNQLSSPSSMLFQQQQQQQDQMNTIPDPCHRFNETMNLIKLKFVRFKLAVLQIPGINYLFNESDMNRITFILSIKSQSIIWLMHALAALVVCSIDEDRYGVVQNDLRRIIKELLEFKLILDKINTINLDGKKLPKNCIALRNALRNCLYKISITFADYLGDLNLEPLQLKAIQNFVNFAES